MIKPGTIIDARYEVVTMLGVGGFGSVVKARQIQFDRLVAIKLLKTTLLDEVDGLARFEREAKAINALQHKNIVAFYGYGAWLDAPYMVMELVEGKSLEDLLVGGKLEAERALKIMAQVFEALDFAHRHGVVHRDLKPSNIMIVRENDGSEVVKIIDFGLAKLMPSYGVPGQKLTETGYALGTCHYMPPEQALGNPVDQRADVYSAGCILQQALTGQLPFDAPDSVAIMFQHVNDPAPPLAASLGKSKKTEALQILIDNCLAKDAADRYPDGSLAARDALSVAAGRYGSLVRWNPASATAGRSPRTSTSKLLLKALVLTTVATLAISGAIYSNWLRTSGGYSGTAGGRQESVPGKDSSTQLKNMYDFHKPLLAELGPHQPRFHKAIAEQESSLLANEQSHQLSDREVYDQAAYLSDNFYQTGNYEKSEKYSKQALELTSKLNKHWIDGRLFQSLACAQIGQQQLDEAIITLEKSVELRNQFDSTSGATISCQLCAQLITLYIDEDRLARANKVADCLRAQIGQAELPHKLESLIALGNLELAKGNFAAAETQFHEALRIYSEGDALSWLGLARAELYQRHFDLAAKYASKALQSDSPGLRHRYLPRANPYLILIIAAAQKKDRASLEKFVLSLSRCQPTALTPRPAKLNDQDISLAAAELHEGRFDDLQAEVEKAARFNLPPGRSSPLIKAGSVEH